MHFTLTFTHEQTNTHTGWNGAAGKQLRSPPFHN